MGVNPILNAGHFSLHTFPCFCALAFDLVVSMYFLDSVTIQLEA